MADDLKASWRNFPCYVEVVSWWQSPERKEHKTKLKRHGNWSKPGQLTGDSFECFSKCWAKVNSSLNLDSHSVKVQTKPFSISCWSTCSSKWHFLRNARVQPSIVQLNSWGFDFKCTLRLYFLANVLPHSSHSFDDLCSMAMCFLKSLHFSATVLQPSWLHGYPWWRRVWRRSRDLRAKARSHLSHLNGLSPVCSARWVLSWNLLLNSFKHSSQLCLFSLWGPLRPSSPWGLFLCLFRYDLQGNDASHPSMSQMNGR